MQPPAQVPLESKYSRLKILGKGSFGEAILVRNKEDQRHYVAKEINLMSMSPKEKEDAKNEIRVLAQLSHPNIVKLHEYLLHRLRLYIVMEWADGGDLDMKVKKARQDNRPFDEDRVMNWFVQLCLAIKHLHDKKILHRDLKAGNVFMMSSGLIKLGDFGISTVLRNTLAQAMTVCGTPYYFSPEICKNRPYNNKSDIWALGCILYEMVTLQHPFNGRNIYELMKSICIGSYSAIPSSFSTNMSVLLTKTLAVNPAMRLSIDNLLRLEYVQEHLRKLQKTSPPEIPQRRPSCSKEKAGPDWLPPLDKRPLIDIDLQREKEREREREREKERIKEREKERERQWEREREREREREKEKQRERERERERAMEVERELQREIEKERERWRARNRDDALNREPSPAARNRTPPGELGAILNPVERKTAMQQLEEWREKEREKERIRNLAVPDRPARRDPSPVDAGVKPRPGSTDEFVRKEYWERRQEAERNKRRLYQQNFESPLDKPSTPQPDVPRSPTQASPTNPLGPRRLSADVGQDLPRQPSECPPIKDPNRRKSDGFLCHLNEERLSSAALEALGPQGNRRRPSTGLKREDASPPAIDRELAEAQKLAFQEMRREAERNKQRLLTDMHTPLRDPKWDDPMPPLRPRLHSVDPPRAMLKMPFPEPTKEPQRKSPKVSEEEELIKMLNDAMHGPNAAGVPSSTSDLFPEDEDIPEELPEEAKVAMERQAMAEFATMRSLIHTILEAGAELLGDEEFGDDEPLM